jgi:hypothetical protein
MVIMSFCVIKLYYIGNHHGMTVNYRGKMFYNMVANLNTAVICNITLTLENVGTTVNYHGIFITLASGLNLFHSF